MLDFMNRSKRRIPKALLAAFAISGAVIWRIGVDSRGGLLRWRKAQVEGAPIPAQDIGTKVHGRDRPEDDPVAAYVGKAKRGMTDREVRWIIGDFVDIGPMPTSGNLQALRDFREKQNNWYLAAISEALSLTSAQKRAVRASLKESLDRAMEVYADLGGTTARLPGIYSEMHFEANLWIRPDEYAPWNLCELTEVQSALTMEQDWRIRNEAAPAAGGDFRWKTEWLGRLTVAMKDPSSGEVLGYPPPSFMDLACMMPGTVRGGIIDISTAFPLTPDQTLADHRNDLAAQAKMLHPAQLRMALLLNPSLAASILQGMDNPAPGE